MTSTPPSTTKGDVVVVVVLFHPDDESVAHIQSQTAAGYHVVAVSNGITPSVRDALGKMDRVSLIDNSTNFGLARALNQGIEQFLASSASFVLLLDQDSRLPSDMIERLQTRAKLLQDEGIAIACVAPRLVDKKAVGASVGTSQPANDEPSTAATSGSLLTRKAIVAVGAMWEDLFIDGIDHEWCFRARAHSFTIAIDRDATLIHHMGDSGIRIGNRFRPLHRSPLRHYHIVRNTLWLQRCRYIPLKWRMKELIKIAYRAPVYVMISSDRRATIGALSRALAEGLAKPRGLPEVILPDGAA